MAGRIRNASWLGNRFGRQNRAGWRKGAACLALLLGAGVAAAQVTPQSTATAQLNSASGLSNAAGVAVDPIGNVYMIDGGNDSLLELTGGNGAANTLLTGLTSPGQVAVDISRNLYIANGTSNVVTEFAYTGGSLNLNAPISIGKGLGTVTGVAVDLSGNVYIVDATNKQVVKVAPGGAQTTVATGLTAPKQVAVDRLGDVYIADAGANAVVYVPAGGGATSTVGSGLNKPQGVAVDPGNNLYIADTGNSVIKEVPYNGGPQTGSQTTLAAAVTSPTSIGIDLRGTLWIAAGANVVHFSSGAIYFALLPTGTTSAVTPVTITFTAAVAPATVSVVSTGLTGLDFNNAGGGTCAAGSYAVGASCTVNVTFTPKFAGVRYGAVVFYDANNKILSQTFIGGGGLGPVITFDTGLVAAVYPGGPNVNLTQFPQPYAITEPHGARFDAAGDLLLANTNADNIVKFPVNNQLAPVVFNIGTFSADDVAIDGAGNLLVPDLNVGRLLLYPWENGTWSLADGIVLGTGYSKPRALGVDIAGNVFLCDASNDRILEFPAEGAQEQIYTGLTKNCLGVAVDLYGNLGVADSTGNTAYYVPATGQTPYAVGTGYSSPWGIEFDASGSLIVANDSITSMFRIPNENGQLSTADQQTIVGNKAYGFAIDPLGNIISTPEYGTSIPTSGYQYIAIIRGTPLLPAESLTPATLSFGGVSVGAMGTAAAVVVGNGGNVAPAYTSGLVQTGDIDDFSLVATVAKPPSYPVCNFTTTLAPGYTCYIGVQFAPTSPDVLRQETLSLPSQQVITPSLLLTGTSSGSAAATGAAGLGLTVTPMGSLSVEEPFTVTITAASGVTGAVTLLIDGTVYASAELSSTTSSATITVTGGLTSGAHKLGATYAGNKTYAPVTTPVTTTVTVVAATATFSIVTSGVSINVGQAVTFTGTVNGSTGLPTPTGTITFFDGTTQLGTATLNSSGTASYSTSALAQGTHTITFHYVGDSVYANGTSGPVTVSVATYATDTTVVTVSPAQPAGGYAYGTALTATATVTPQSGTQAPTGTVQFILDGVITTVPVTNKVATLTFTPNAGSHTLSGDYSGDSSFAASTSAPVTFVTNKESTTTTLSASSTAFAAGSNDTLTATVSAALGVPTGTVTFKNANTVLGTAALNGKGVATLTTSALPAGSDSVVAFYSGDQNNTGSGSPPLVITVTINATTLTVTSNQLITYPPNEAYPTITATVSSTAPATVVVPPGGTVTFSVNGVVVGSATVGAGMTASISPTTFPTGVVTLTATYSGDGNYSGSTSPPDLIYVVPTTGYAGDYSISMSPNPLTMTIGTIGTGTITASPVAGTTYFGIVQLTCAGLPLYTNCVITPNQLTLNGTGASQTANISVLSQAPILVSSTTRREMLTRMCGALGAPMLLALLMGSSRRGRRKLRAMSAAGLLSMLLLAAGAGSLSACGGHPPISTPPGTYTVQITATGSGGYNHTYAEQMTFQ